MSRRSNNAGSASGSAAFMDRTESGGVDYAADLPTRGLMHSSRRRASLENNELLNFEGMHRPGQAPGADEANVFHGWNENANVHAHHPEKANTSPLAQTQPTTIPQRLSSTESTPSLNARSSRRRDTHSQRQSLGTDNPNPRTSTIPNMRAGHEDNDRAGASHWGGDAYEASAQPGGEGGAPMGQIMDVVTSILGGGGDGRGEDTFELPDKRDDRFLNAVLRGLYTNDAGLVHLDMSDAGIVDGMIPRLANALGKNSVLRSLSLATNDITHASMQDFAAGVELNNTLRSIDLAENGIAKQGATALAAVLGAKTQLVGLDLSGNLIRDSGARAVMGALMDVEGIPIEWLNLSENSLSDHTAADVSAVIDSCRSLTVLDISRNAFMTNGLRIISDELARNNTLKHLNLAHIHLNVEAMEFLTHALARNVGLVTLDLYGCNVGNQGATRLGAAIAVNSTLTSLDIGTNAIAEEGFQLFADGLMVNSSVAVLRMWGNAMHSASSRLLNALLQNDTVTELDVAGCGGDERDLGIIAGLVRKNKRVRDGARDAEQGRRFMREAALLRDQVARLEEDRERGGKRESRRGARSAARV